jgi:hypothetical protein
MTEIWLETRVVPEAEVFCACKLVALPACLPWFSPFLCPPQKASSRVASFFQSDLVLFVILGT